MFRKESTILVLGSKVRGAQPGHVLRWRLEHALELSRHTTGPIVVSGKGEAYVMDDWLIRHGVDYRRLIVEPEATSTNENIENAHALLPDTQEWLVVTSDFHKLRTLAWARHLGVPIRVSSAVTKPPFRVNNFVRECFALPHSLLRIAWRRLLV
ncbi:YdcF family protein [Corynebacterium diphtheriae bv. gravis]|uniref:YdcF family protein n=1 Tax=Corynebacterium diphtheriae TaxID=1717 RepID=UPI0018CB379B|nr:YdcF family protein [Corynebacterium diphtheriae]MBG9295681.1 YdcF family protein [Corynebacterium diphtheriae bv. gravis]